MGLGDLSGSVIPTFLLGAPRSGTTLLERMLSSHSLVKGGPEPHLLTPLAYLGVWGRVDKAPYDHIVAAIGQQAFVRNLPQQEQDYWHACRSYCDVLYTAYMQQARETVCLDKTPEYVTVWPFLTKVYPDAKYIVLTRHPAAILASFANSFFDGDFSVAQRHDPILERYVPALAGFLRQTEVQFVQISYENLVREPEKCLTLICDYLGIPFEPEAVNYGGKQDRQAAEAGLGDPIGVGRHSRPNVSNLDKWVREYASDSQRQDILRQSIARIDPGDLATIGYPEPTFWEWIERAEGHRQSTHNPKLTRYRLQRKLIIRLRGMTQRNAGLKRGIAWLRMVCDVLLREY
jgi:hypothetical protein